MTAADRLSLAGLGATLAAGVPLFSITQDRSYLFFGLLLMGLSFGIGSVARRVGLGEAAVRVTQLLPVVLVPILVPAIRNPGRLAVQTIDYVQQSFAPMPYQEGFAVFTTLLLWLTYLGIETLTIAWRSPAWTFPVLVLPYAVSALAIYAEASPLLFAFPAVGWAAVLATEVRNQALAALPQPVRRGHRTGVTRSAVIATLAALLLGAVLTAPIAERSAGAANPGGSGAVLLGDPSLDLIRNVTAASDQQVISYTPSDEGGHYLRLAALSAFDDRGFHLTSTDLVPLPLNAARPDIPGAREVRTEVKVAELSSEYLPVPWVPTAAEVPENWRYDPRTMAVVAIGNNRQNASRRLEYTVTSTRLPDIEGWLAEAGVAGTLDDGGTTLDVPDEISPEIRQLAEQVTAGLRTDGEKALALRDFLRSDAFTYSTVVGPGSTLQTLNDFLLGGRTGYCEQFAGGLAVLSRMVGIPSRVVVGFLPGKQVGDHWEVSARNMHAWAELYFGDGIGWVPLDGTPAAAVGAPTPSVSPTPRSTSASPSAAPTSAAPSASVQPEAQTGSVEGGGSVPWPAVSGVLASLLLVGAGPTLVRRGLRWRRLTANPDPAGALEDAWAEVRAVALDRGADWPVGSSRQVAAALGAELDPASAAELTALALLLEQARYSGQPPVAAVGLAGRVRKISSGMEKRWATPTALLRRWWPASLWPQRPSS